MAQARLWPRAPFLGCSVVCTWEGLKQGPATPPVPHSQLFSFPPLGSHRQDQQCPLAPDHVKDQQERGEGCRLRVHGIKSSHIPTAEEEVPPGTWAPSLWLSLCWSLVRWFRVLPDSPRLLPGLSNVMGISEPGRGHGQRLAHRGCPALCGQLPHTHLSPPWFLKSGVVLVPHSFPRQQRKLIT